MPELHHGFNIGTAFRAIAEDVPDHLALVWRDRRLTYGEMLVRAENLASHLVARGFGCHTERATLSGHESGQDHIGLYLLNGNEYPESLIATALARAVGFNVNYRYVEEELASLLLDAQTSGLVYHARFAPQVAALRDRLPDLRLLVQVADESGHALLDGALAYEDLVAAPADVALPEPSGDDLFLLFTGGTTGMPKGVLWRQHDVFVSSMGGTPVGSDVPHADYPDLVANGGDPRVMMMVPPFMHAAATWSAYWTFVSKGTLVIPSVVDRMDPSDVLTLIGAERVNMFPVVGDAVAIPLVDEIERGDYDLSSLFAITNGGAPLSPATRARLLEALPQLFLIDGAGSSETGMQMMQTLARGSDGPPGVFVPGEQTRVVDDLKERVLAPGAGAGWLARTGNIPLGYLGDAAKSAATFPVIEGQRWSVPGDRAEFLSDGSIRLLGRDSLTINSGGEKIFVEEVERALIAHPAVSDVMVTGRPSARWGAEVVALVTLRPDLVATSDEELLGEAGKHVARYKLPKEIIRVDTLQRSPSGKADYRWARAQVTTTP